MPTPEENARFVLEIFAHFNVRPGEVLLPGNLTVITDNRGRRREDLLDGLQRAEELGWIEAADNDAVRLTEGGFAEM